MCAKKIKEKDEPTLGGAIIYGVLIALLGAILGFVFLASSPAIVYASVVDYENFLETDAAFEPAKPGDAYYFDVPSARGRGWEAKRDQILSGDPATVEISAGQLNAWMGAKFTPGEQKDSQVKSSVMITPGIPKFFVAGEDALYVNLPIDLSVYDNKRKYTVFSKGHFSSGPSVRFVIDELHVNCAVIPVEGGVASKFVGALISAYSATEEFDSIRAAFDQVESVELSGETLRVTLR